MLALFFQMRTIKQRSGCAIIVSILVVRVAIRYFSCECGPVEAHGGESGMLCGHSGYIIVSLPTNDEPIGRMYYFEKNDTVDK
jgi:hypothetical protein